MIYDIGGCELVSNAILREFYNDFFNGICTVYKNTNEYMWYDEGGNQITIEFQNKEQPVIGDIIVRKYYMSGRLKIEVKYKNGLLHGRSMGWHSDGSRWFSHNYRRGKRHGVYEAWHDDGSHAYCDEYKNNRLCSRQADVLFTLLDNSTKSKRKPKRRKRRNKHQVPVKERHTHTHTFIV